MAVLGFLRGIGWLAIIIGFGGGLLVGGILYLFTRLGNRRLARQGFGAANTDVIQERSVEISLPAAAAFDACLTALKVFPRIRILKENRIGGKIDARTRMTWRSFGELITVKVSNVGDYRARILIRSEPATRQKVDYGKSVENVELFLRQIGR
jgi:hypothetical protein